MLCMYIAEFFAMFSVYYRHFEDKKQYVIENINEIIVLFTIYHLFCFTRFVPNGYEKAYIVGFSLLALTLTNMVANLGPVTFEIL